MRGHDNLTGGQIQHVLDYLIYEALRPVVMNSCIFDLQLSHVLIHAAGNKKRKLSALPREEFLSKAANTLSESSGDVKFEYIIGLKLERGFVYNFLVNFINRVANYTTLYLEYMTCTKPEQRVYVDQQLRVVEDDVGFQREHLFPTLQNVSSWLELAYEFRNSIVMQYHKHAIKKAHQYAGMKGENFDVQDLSQNLLAAVTKAIDKYDSSQGALTSYVNFWIMNAQTYASSEHGHEYGIAYTIPQGHRKTIAGGNSNGISNFSVSLDSALEEDEDGSLHSLLVGASSVEDVVIAEDELTKMLRLAKYADPKGIGRLYLDLDEVFSKREVRQMRRTMVRQKTVK